METDIKIRAFRAPDDEATCIKFIEGHKKVLENHGIEKVTSSNDSWMYNKAVFVVVVEAFDTGRLYGGARVHAADGITPLPIEAATWTMDPKIKEYVRYYSQWGTGELCGLWNSVEVAGLGIGSLFPSRVAVVISEQIGLNSMFSLCSPVTVRFNQWIGSEVFSQVGNNGTFYYPKLDLIATAVFLEDAVNLPNAHPKEREKMLFLRKNPNAVLKEKSPFKSVEVNVHYQLQVASANKDEFKISMP